MRPLARYRLWRARTVPANALLWAFAAGAASAVPVTIWSGLGQREVVRIVRGGPQPGGQALTPPLRQSLKDLDRWSRPSAISPEVEALLGALDAEAGPFAEGCAPREVTQALARQLSAQRTVSGARLTVDPFATGAFQLLTTRAGEAAPCVEGALERVGAAERVELVRLLARLGMASGSAAVKAGLEREVVRAADAGREVALVYALHGYLAVENDLNAAQDLLARALRLHADPGLRAALREVASRRFAALVPAEALL